MKRIQRGPVRGISLKLQVSYCAWRSSSLQLSSSLAVVAMVKGHDGAGGMTGQRLGGMGRRRVWAGASYLHYFVLGWFGWANVSLNRVLQRPN